jgi:hypothetical protein
MADLDGAAGEFWLPNAPNDRLLGRYEVVESGGVEVELYGAFGHETATPFGGLPVANMPLLRGQVGDNTITGGTEVTLLDLVPQLSSARMRRFTANRTIEGAGFNSLDDIQVTLATVRLGYLDDWVDRAAGSWETDESDENYPHIHRPIFHEDLVANVPGAEVRLRSLGSEFISHAEIAFRVSSEFLVTTDEPVGLDDLFFRFLRPLRDLLSLATSYVVRVESQEIGVPGQEHHGFPVMAQVRAHRGQASDSPARVRQPEMLVTPDVVPFADLLRRWYDVEDRATVAISFWLSARQSTDVLTKTSDAITALESLHRALHGDGSPSQRHQDRMTRMQAVLENRDWRWLQRFVSRSHEPTLERRLIDLADALGDCRARIVGPGNAWAQEMVRIRNAVAHGLDQAITVGMDVRRTLALSHLAIAVAEARLALAVGVSDAALAKELDQRWTIWSRDVEHYSQWLPDLYA